MVIGAFDFVIAHAQPSAIASRDFSYHCSAPDYGKRKGIADSGGDQHCEAATTPRPFGVFNIEGGLQTSGQGELSKLCGNETARYAGNP